MKPLIIIRDTREQQPFKFQRIDPPPKVEVSTLKTGDYSLKSFENDHITVERKSLSDLFLSFGQGRQRFQREIERMQDFHYAAVVVEGDWIAVLRNPHSYSSMNPKTIYASVIAWEQRYGVSFWMCPNRAFAEKTTYRILERFYRDHLAGE